MLTLSVIIVSFNSERFLDDCLSTLLNQTENIDRILVVDNNSNDRSVEIAAQFDNVELFAIEENIGYAAALNAGIRKAETDLVVTSNPDTKFDKCFSENVKKRFEAEKDIDIASPLILRFEEGLIDSAGQELSIACYPLETGYGKRVGEVDLSERSLFSVCGAVTIFRRSSLEKLKIKNDYYDENFFMFWEDLDIGWRAELLGMKKKLCPEIISYHYRGSTMKKTFFSRFSMAMGRPAEIKYHLVKNRYLTLIKNFRLKNDWFRIPFIILKDVVWAGLLTLSSPKIIIRFRELPGLFGETMKKREIIKKNE